MTARTIRVCHDTETGSVTRRTIALVALLTVTAGLVAGGVAVSRSAWDDGAWRRRTDNVRTDPSETLDRIDPAAARPAPPFAGPTRPIPALPPAVDRIGAVHDLLDGLIAGDTNRSYSALASADRAAVGTEASWEERVHALPHYLAYTVTGSDGGNVTTNVTIEPRLDEVVGYVPARAQVTWTTVAEEGRGRPPAHRGRHSRRAWSCRYRSDRPWSPAPRWTPRPPGPSDTARLKPPWS